MNQDPIMLDTVQTLNKMEVYAQKSLQSKYNTKGNMWLYPDGRKLRSLHYGTQL